MWKIKQIFDGEYGCEEPAPGAKPKVSVTLVNEFGEEKYVSVEDEWLTAQGLDVGCTWTEENVHHGRYNEPGPKGKDVYNIKDKVKAHMTEIKNENEIGKEGI